MQNSASSHLNSENYFTAQGIILFRQVYQENDYILDILSATNYRFSALAKNARKSVKRFSGGLEPLQVLSFSVKAPRENSYGDKLFFLEGAQVVEFFDGYKKSWTLLSDGLFLTEFLREALPKGEQEVWVYEHAVNLLKRFSTPEFSDIASTWKRVFFWSSLSAKLGYGLLGERGRLKHALGDHEELWIGAHSAAPEDLEVILRPLTSKKLDKNDLKDLYSDWIERSHLRCKAVETWINT